MKTHSPIKYPEYMSTVECARMLNVTVDTIREMSRDGRLPFYVIGKRRRYSKAQIEKLFAAEVGEPDAEGQDCRS